MHASSTQQNSSLDRGFISQPFSASSRHHVYIICSKRKKIGEWGGLEREEASQNIKSTITTTTTNHARRHTTTHMGGRSSHQRTESTRAVGGSDFRWSAELYQCSY